MSLVTPTILSGGKEMDPAFALVSIDITKEVNRVPDAQLVLVDGDTAEKAWPVSDAAFFEPGKEVEIKLRYEEDAGSEATVFKGLVLRHGIELQDDGSSYLTVEMKDAAVKLTAPRRSLVFRDVSDSEAIGKILQAAGLKKGKLEATKPKHPELVQYRATDWDFILSRAEVQGQLVVADDGAVSMAPLAVKGSAKRKFELGIDELYNLEIEADAGHQVAGVESSGWDPKKQKLTPPKKAKAVRLAPGNLDGKRLAGAVGFDDTLLSHPVPLAPEELQAWADAGMAKSRIAMLRGRLSLPGIAAIKPLDIIEIAGVGQRFEGKTLVTGVRHRVDDEGWRTDLQFGLAPEWFGRREDVREAPAAGLLPPVSGLQVGVVAAFEEDPDKEFRLKVLLPGVDETDGKVWARLATPDAGKARGYFFRPEPGDEVVVGFFNDDPRQAVVLGAMYGSKNTPPAGVSELSDKNVDKAIVTKAGTQIAFADADKASVFIETPGQNKILLDDEGEKIELADQHGNKVTLDKNGIVLKSAKDFKIDASGKVEIKGSKVDVK